MNLIHGPMITPPGLEELAQRNYPNDLGENERKMGHMITYMDMIVGKFLDKLKEIGQEENTLVIFTGDNGTAGTVSRLGDFHVRGGKRTMNEAGTRVPFIARWPGKIPAGVRDSFFTLMDVLPTLAAVANIPVEHEIDGMDLSHTFFDQPGIDREYFNMAFEGELYFVRDKRFRLHEDGRFYDVSIESNETRYSMEVLSNHSRHASDLNRLQARLAEYQRIQKTDDSYSVVPFGTGGDNFKNAQDQAAGRPNL